GSAPAPMGVGNPAGLFASLVQGPQGVSVAPPVANVPAATGATSLAGVVPGLGASALDRVFASLPEAGQGVAVGHSRLGLPDWVFGQDPWQDSPLGTDGRPL